MSSLQKTGQWWVLAVGEDFDEDTFDQREKCRAELLHKVNEAGIELDENVWVYDESKCAQLVLRVCSDRERAEDAARELEDSGLSLRIAREFE
ncbi:hypothetical protein [Maridesulfovibrio salexigens]|uniref:Uncharacterized protein n=1 Tax=Maridesulfovibrio salexigens (strain ATCC 14822 / DSM 2638 / NCIMB 8403 / VKM B-1763) TaxID=526222 RepID=C6C0L5_MARSD|nr:hypothetical protein [Maridesulfovibrio salexigens]ACS79149.1 hypothetical protein Desal_1085 [Maridesulfovibrio salexigens DSM 2638]